MKKLIIGLILVSILLASALAMQPGCSWDSGLPDFSGNTTGIIDVDYAKYYESIRELAADADLIAVGPIDRTIEIVPDEATRDRAYLTRSAFRVERVVNGNGDGEIIISQMGAVVSLRFT